MLTSVKTKVLTILPWSVCVTRIFETCAECPRLDSAQRHYPTETAQLTLVRRFETQSQHTDIRLVVVLFRTGAPQWGAADAEIKVPSGENTELKRSPFQAWGRSVYSHTCYAYCQGFLPCLFLHFQSINLHFF